MRRPPRHRRGHVTQQRRLTRTALLRLLRWTPLGPSASRGRRDASVSPFATPDCQECSPMTPSLMTPDALRKTDACWQAANDLSVGQIHLRDNPLLKGPMTLSHVKPLVVGLWGTTPGQELHLRPPEPCHQEKRLEHVLHHRAGPWRPCHRGECVLGRDLERGVSQRTSG